MTIHSCPLTAAVGARCADRNVKAAEEIMAHLQQGPFSSEQQAAPSTAVPASAVSTARGDKSRGGRARGSGQTKDVVAAGEEAAVVLSLPADAGVLCSLCQVM